MVFHNLKFEIMNNWQICSDSEKIIFVRYTTFKNNIEEVLITVKFIHREWIITKIFNKYILKFTEYLIFINFDIGI